MLRSSQFVLVGPKTEIIKAGNVERPTQSGNIETKIASLEHQIGTLILARDHVIFKVS